MLNAYIDVHVSVFATHSGVQSTQEQRVVYLIHISLPLIEMMNFSEQLTKDVNSIIFAVFSSDGGYLIRLYFYRWHF